MDLVFIKGLSKGVLFAVCYFILFCLWGKLQSVTGEQKRLDSISHGIQCGSYSWNSPLKTTDRSVESFSVLNLAWLGPWPPSKEKAAGEFRSGHLHPEVTRPGEQGVTWRWIDRNQSLREAWKTWYPQVQCFPGGLHTCPQLTISSHCKSPDCCIPTAGHHSAFFLSHFFWHSPGTQPVPWGLTSLPKSPHRALCCFGDGLIPASMQHLPQ